MHISGIEMLIWILSKNHSELKCTHSIDLRELVKQVLFAISTWQYFNAPKYVKVYAKVTISKRRH